MQNFDDLDIEGRQPSIISEEDREKVMLFVFKVFFSYMTKCIMLLVKGGVCE